MTPLLTRDPVDLPRRESLRRLSSLWVAMAAPLLGTACGSGGEAPSSGPAAAQPAPDLKASATSKAVPTAKATVLTGVLESPWGMAFLPDGRILVTQKAGSMVIVSSDGSQVSTPLAGVRAVYSFGQAGLLDVALDPDFGIDGNAWVYFSYVTGSVTTGIAVDRARLSGTQLLDRTTLYSTPRTTGDANFGSRLAFRRDKTLFITIGERSQDSPAQDLRSPLGKVLRITREGGVPNDNPVWPAGSLPEIWSYGHRNPQGAAIHPDTGGLLVTEHGPQGGDELNVAKAGRNFGWPEVSYGCAYGVKDVTLDCRLGGTRGVHAPRFTEPAGYWPAPSIAPSSLMFYTGDKFPEWQGNAFVGALAGLGLWRVVLNGETAVGAENVFGTMFQRIRCVRQGPDGWIYLLTDAGQLIRVER